MFHWNKDAKDRTVGNINEKSLREIWREPAFLAFRKAHLEQKLDEYPLCQTCDGWAAYTNVWDRTNAGFAYAPVRARDFLERAREQRGG
jgi:MoaA/NifB/PqqE/SkfB family radical SAM enzyme